MEEEVISSFCLIPRSGLHSHRTLQIERRTTRGGMETPGRGSKKENEIQSGGNTSSLVFFDFNNYLVSLYKHQSYIIDSGGSLWMEACLTCCPASV